LRGLLALMLDRARPVAELGVLIRIALTTPAIPLATPPGEKIGRARGLLSDAHTLFADIARV